ncbi:MerR family transcriptional regulator [Nigerium massiliense]|uniref:MerR family transcriptional regulator n=1 Tax=Nigerium massiliense TaxID=1522317 RepID=UPI00058EE173|nr:MerR family transcriptional regulator [Nigerium massiliense]
MRLKELAERSGTSQASIKYYLRERLLPPGRRINATLAEYDESHLMRLRLIAALRQIVGTPIEEIRALVAMLDAPQPDRYETLGRAQLVALGLPVGAQAPAASEPDVVTDLLEGRGWTHATEVRGLLAEQVRAMLGWGIPVPRERLESYADATAVLAQEDIGYVESAGSLDEAVLRVAVGTYTFNQLFLRTLAVAQAERARGPAVSAPD